jgi:predicted RNase H-like nuclease (RuvC/YqgF family)
MLSTTSDNTNSITKKDSMPELKIKQIQHEIDTWKRLLSFMQEENVYLKNRLSEVLKDRFDNSLLEEVDDYQSSFIKADELITFFRNEAAEIESALHLEIFKGRKIKQTLENKMALLQIKLTNAEKEFSALKLKFNNYISLNT